MASDKVAHQLLLKDFQFKNTLPPNAAKFAPRIKKPKDFLYVEYVSLLLMYMFSRDSPDCTLLVFDGKK